MHTTPALRSSSLGRTTTLGRTILALGLGLALATGACATTGARPVNVAAVRHEIDDTIQAQRGDRRVTSMGRVAPGRAVVYTTTAAGARHEEVWLKEGATWRLHETTALAGGPAAPASGARATR